MSTLLERKIIECFQTHTDYKEQKVALMLMQQEYGTLPQILSRKQNQATKQKRQSMHLSKHYQSNQFFILFYAFPF